jgi:hypothetical protein
MIVRILRVIGGTLSGIGTVAAIFLVTDVGGDGWLRDRPVQRLEIAFALSFIGAALHELTRTKRPATNAADEGAVVSEAQRG